MHTDENLTRNSASTMNDINTKQPCLAANFKPNKNVARMIRLKKVSNLRFLPLTEMSIGGISYASPRKLIGQAQTGVINNRYHPPKNNFLLR